MSGEKYSSSLRSLSTYWQMRDSTTSYIIIFFRNVILVHGSVLIYL